MATRAFSHDTGPLQLCLILCSTVSGWFESYPRLALTLVYLAFFINEIRMPFFFSRTSSTRSNRIFSYGYLAFIDMPVYRVCTCRLEVVRSLRTGVTEGCELPHES